MTYIVDSTSRHCRSILNAQNLPGRIICPSMQIDMEVIYKYGHRKNTRTSDLHNAENVDKEWTSMNHGWVRHTQRTITINLNLIAAWPSSCRVLHQRPRLILSCHFFWRAQPSCMLQYKTLLTYHASGNSRSSHTSVPHAHHDHHVHPWQLEQYTTFRLGLSGETASPATWAL